MKISVLINAKMPTIVGIFIFISREMSMKISVNKVKVPAIVCIFIFISRENFMHS